MAAAETTTATAMASSASSAPCSPSARDLFAEGLLEFLRPAVRQLDSHVHAVRAKWELREHIDGLAAELCRIKEDQKVALDLDPYVKKLLNARRRVVLVNNILQNAQVRVYGCWVAWANFGPLSRCFELQVPPFLTASEPVLNFKFHHS
uniref:Biogenesis of lysosome-related organelles complex 1 subunit 7 n=1 Tax=Anolis carolinensis TaxID=28377 RepID=A0A803TAP7_ANOCA